MSKSNHIEDFVKDGNVKLAAATNLPDGTRVDVRAYAAALQLKKAPNRTSMILSRIAGGKRELVFGIAMAIMGITGIGFYLIVNSSARPPMLLLVASVGLLALGMAAATVSMLDRVGT